MDQNSTFFPLFNGQILFSFPYDFDESFGRNGRDLPNQNLFVLLLFCGSSNQISVPISSSLYVSLVLDLFSFLSYKGRKLIVVGFLVWAVETVCFLGDSTSLSFVDPSAPHRQLSQPHIPPLFGPIFGKDSLVLETPRDGDEKVFQEISGSNGLLADLGFFPNSTSAGPPTPPLLFHHNQEPRAQRLMHQILTCPEDQLQGFLSRIVEWNYAKARPLPPHPNPLPPP